MLDTETGELLGQRLEHENGEARAFYGALQGRVRVGIEATGYTCLQKWTWRRRIVLLKVRQLNGASSVCPALLMESAACGTRPCLLSRAADAYESGLDTSEAYF
jgi:hypothetical protein